MSILYRFLRSVRLAIVLIVLLVVLAAVATLIPQGREAAFYRERYPALITALHLDKLFSVIFLVPLALFALNLAVCSVDRFVTRMRTGARRRHGPDILHLGLLVLLAGGVVTATLRQEEPFYLGEGDQVELPGGTRLQLLAFRTLSYESGAPKDWISTLRVESPGAVARSVDVEVNRPLKIGGIRIYQSSYAVEGFAHLSDASGAVTSLSTGDALPDGDAQWLFASVQRPPGGVVRGVFERWRDGRRESAVEAGTGDTVGPWTVTVLSARDLTGLEAVRDPGSWPVLAGFVLVGVGLALTFLQKRGELRP